MCVYSNIVDYSRKLWPQPEPWIIPPFEPFVPTNPWAYPTEPEIQPQPYNGPTKEQFEELLELLKVAKKFDEKTNQPDCELEEKKNFIKELAKKLNVKLPKDF